MQHFFTEFWIQLQSTSWYEFIAVLSGIASVWFSKKENVLVYPIGLISTSIYIVLSFQKDLIGEASVNFYYTVMSLVGWYLWLQKEPNQKNAILQIRFSKTKELLFHFALFLVAFIGVYLFLFLLKESFYPGVIPWADGLATATAFTGMYLMINKKVESWYWWIATNFISIPLYYVKGMAMTSIYYFILLIIAYFGLMEWTHKAKKTRQKKATVQEESSFTIERYF